MISLEDVQRDNPDKKIKSLKMIEKNKRFDFFNITVVMETELFGVLNKNSVVVLPYPSNEYEELNDYDKILYRFDAQNILF
jgi:hypothetical protein